MMTLFTACHRCGELLVLSEAHGECTVRCERCYDPVEDADVNATLLGRGATPEDALQNWYDERESLDLEPEFVPTTLAEFVVPKAPADFIVSSVSECTDGSGYENLSQAERAHWLQPESPIYYGKAS